MTTERLMRLRPDIAALPPIVRGATLRREKQCPFRAMVFGRMTFGQLLTVPDAVVDVEIAALRAGAEDWRCA
jgi:hypothetical protein